MAEGVLIAESLADLSVLDQLSTRDQFVVEAEEATRGQPVEFTLIYFEIPPGTEKALAQSLAQALAPGHWYADFQSESTKWVIFPRRVFTFPRGDQAGDAQAKEYGRGMGIPDAQLGWAE